ncbi:MAG: ABC transporter permease [Nanoarchaeota archaeon]|nr:ABC transporter permease [Nanoarchaeota archaeon]MCK5629173.1 ABC transporter permease [Nanoarchaeota archaeon]
MDPSRNNELKIIFGIPFYLWYSLLFIVPVITLLITSLFSYKNYQIVRIITFDNYLNIFTSKIFYISLMNSLTIAIIVSILTTIISFFTAYFIHTRISEKYKKFAIAAIILPLLTNYLLRAYSWSLVLSNQGVINWFLLKMGLISEPLPLLFSKFAIILGLISFLTPILVLLIYLGLSMMLRETITTSLDLGVSELKTVFKVVMPQIKKFLLIAIFLSFIISMSDYVMPAILGGGNIYTYSYNIIDTNNINNLPKASALGTILVLFITIIGLFLFRGKKNE